MSDSGSTRSDTAVSSTPACANSRRPRWRSRGRGRSTCWAHSGSIGSATSKRPRCAGRRSTSTATRSTSSCRGRGGATRGGAELFIDDPSLCESIWELVAAAGASYDIGPGAPNATERIENVLLSYGTDTGYQADPIELGLADHLDLEGPEFIGRSALRRIRDDGPRRRLTGAVIDGADIDVLAHPVPFVVDGTEIGQLRAATQSPRFDRNIGLALVEADAVSGATGRVDLPDGERGARLVGLPFDDTLGD